MAGISDEGLMTPPLHPLLRRLDLVDSSLQVTVAAFTAMVVAAGLGGPSPTAVLQERTISLSRKMNGGRFIFSTVLEQV